MDVFSNKKIKIRIIINNNTMKLWKIVTYKLRNWDIFCRIEINGIVWRLHIQVTLVGASLCSFSYKSWVVSWNVTSTFYVSRFIRSKRRLYLLSETEKNPTNNNVMNGKPQWKTPISMTSLSMASWYMWKGKKRR